MLTLPEVSGVERCNWSLKAYVHKSSIVWHGMKLAILSNMCRALQSAVTRPIVAESVASHIAATSWCKAP